MTRQTALAKLLNSEGDNYSLVQIIIIKRALRWYDDEIDDVKVLYMSDEEYKEFQHDIETAAMYINDLMHNYVD